MTAASTKRIVSLTQLDSAYDKISLCPSFVFALPPTWKEEDARMRVEQVKQASERVVHKWRVLAGRPVWTKAGVWAITVPDHFEALSTSRPLVGFTTTTIAKRYYEAAGLSTPLPSLSSRRSGFLPPPLHPLFRHHSVPTTLAKHASTGAPLVNIHLTLLLDAVCIGVSVPHGVLDGRGTGMLLSAMGAEMRGREWQAPPLPEVGEENPVGSALEKLNEDDGLPSTAVSGSLAPLKAERQPMTLLGLVRFFTNVFWQKIWWRSEQRWLFLRQQVVDRLAREVKEEVQKETEGREHVSTGDVLHAWLLKTAHSADSHLVDTVSAVAVYCTRSLLSPYSSSSLSSYASSAIFPYSLLPRPVPLLTLSQTSTAALALAIRRNLPRQRNLPVLRALWKKLKSSPPLLPVRDWPFPSLFRRWKPCTSHRWSLSDQRGVGLGSFSLPHPHPRSPPTSSSSSRVGNNTPLDLPLLLFYLNAAKVVHPDHTMAMQQTKGGVVFSGSMRRARWEALGKAVEKLEAVLEGRLEQPFRRTR